MRGWENQATRPLPHWGNWGAAYLSVALDAPPPALGLAPVPQLSDRTRGRQSDRWMLRPGSWLRGPCYFPTQSHIWNSVFLRLSQLGGVGKGANLSANGVGKDFGNISCPWHSSRTFPRSWAYGSTSTQLQNHPGVIHPCSWHYKTARPSLPGFLQGKRARGKFWGTAGV